MPSLIIMLKILGDKIRFWGFPRMEKHGQKDPHPECAFHALEVSTRGALKNFITFYVKRAISTKAQEALKDILPNPGYHDAGFFHTDGNAARWAGCKLHYHILLDRIPTEQDVRDAVKRLENLGGTFDPEVLKSIEEFYSNKQEEK